MEANAARLAFIADAVEPLLARVGEEQSMAPALPGGWSRKELLAHLIDSASNNQQRFVRATQQNSLEFPGYDQTGNVAIQVPQQAPWPVLTALWASYNRYLAHVIRHLPAQKLDTVCRIGDNAPGTLAFIVDDYIGHLERHLKQIGIEV